MFWSESKRRRFVDLSILEQVHKFRHKEMLIEFEHVKAHRTEKEKQQMLLFEKLITEAMKKRMSKQKKKPCWMRG